ncbi:MAG: sugar phosphate nucleotidyltransferase [Actinomycetota bacterium]
MKALILAGGLGTRLRPLTFTRPKHLLPIANRPHIEHIFDLLLEHGVKEAVLLTSYLAETFEQTVRAGEARGILLEVTHEEEPLGTAGAIKNAESLLGDEAFLVFNGDILTDADLTSITGWHRDKGAEATIVLSPVENPSAFGVVPTDEDGRVLGFIEKPLRDEAPTNLINAGIYVFEPSVLERIPSGEVWSAERQLFPGLVDEGAALYATAIDSYWMDVGTPDKYLQANLDALAGRYRDPEIVDAGEGSSLLGEGAVVAADARISSACLGSRSEVGSKASIERSVTLPRVKIGKGARVVDSIIGERAEVRDGAEVVGMTVADGSEVDG